MMLDLERIAFSAGNPFSLALVNGSWRLCETCNAKACICIHPTRGRFPEYIVGVNMVKTAEKAGMPIRFPIQGHPELMAFLLTDLREMEIWTFSRERPPGWLFHPDEEAHGVRYTLFTM